MCKIIHKTSSPQTRKAIYVSPPKMLTHKNARHEKSQISLRENAQHFIPQYLFNLLCLFYNKVEKAWREGEKETLFLGIEMRNIFHLSNRSFVLPVATG